MRQKIKILQVQARYNVNKSDLAEQIIKSLPKERYEVVSVYLKGRPDEYGMISCSGKIEYLDLSSKECKGSRRKPLELLSKLCEKEKFDVVIAHRFKPIHMLLKLNKKFNFKKLIGVVHGVGDYDRLYRKFEIYRSLKSNCRIVAVSKTVKSYLLKSHAGFNGTNTVCINNAIDINEARRTVFLSAKAKEVLGLSNDKLVIGTIGRLVPVKGQVHLIKAFIELAKEDPKIELVVIGGGRLESELKLLAKKSGFSDRIHLPGAIEDAYKLITAFDVFVLPSLSEGLPLALLEAMAVGLPVLGSNIPQIAGILPRANDVFDVKNEQDLIGSLKRFCSLTRLELKEIGNNNFIHAQKFHSIEQFRELYFNLIENDFGN